MTKDKTTIWEQGVPALPSDSHTLRISDNGVIRVTRNTPNDKWWLWSLHSGGVREGTADPPFDRAIEVAIERAETWLAELKSYREQAKGDQL